MYASKLNLILEMQRPEKAADEYGEIRLRYSRSYHVYAERVNVTTRRVIEAGEMADDYEAAFNVRWRHKIRPLWRFKVQGEDVLYEVTGMVPNRKRGLRMIKAVKVNN